MEASVSDTFHPFFKLVQVIDTLCLNKIGTGIALLCQSRHPQFKWIGKRIGCRTDKHFRWVLNIISALELALIPHILHHLKELDGINIMHVGRHGVIAKVGVITG